ncbi:hypothetical protein CGRA01v4_14095 [Colletotrichum graminicola]|nr:hypothetical protein CGRA01v4_14095 [Colletotrichum graminicola]
MSTPSMFIHSTYLKTEGGNYPKVLPLPTAIDSPLWFHLEFLRTNVMPRVSTSAIFLSRQFQFLPSFVL